MSTSYVIIEMKPDAAIVEVDHEDGVHHVDVEFEPGGREYDLCVLEATMKFMGGEIDVEHFFQGDEGNALQTALSEAHDKWCDDQAGP